MLYPVSEQKSATRLPQSKVTLRQEACIMEGSFFAELGKPQLSFRNKSCIIHLPLKFHPRPQGRSCQQMSSFLPPIPVFRLQ